MIAGALITCTAFWILHNNHAESLSELQSKYEAIVKAKSDSLHLFTVMPSRSYAILDSQVSRYIGNSPLKYNPDFMRLDSLPDSSIHLSPRQLGALNYMALEYESCNNMVKEFPEIIKHEKQKAYSQGRHDGLITGLVIGGIGIIATGLAVIL